MSREGLRDKTVDESRTFPWLSRRRALKAGASVVGVGAIGGLGLWYGSEPSVAASVDNTGAQDVVFDTSKNVVSVAEVTLAPEVAVAFDGFSKGVAQAEIAVTATINANESSSDYSLTQDTWNAPDGDSDDHVEVTISDTIATDGSSNEVFSYDTDSGSNSVPVQTPDLTAQKSQSLSEGENFLVGWDNRSASDPAQPLPVQKAIEQSGELASGTGKEMFPQSVDADHYGLSVVDLAYQITLIDEDGGSDSVAASDSGQDDLAHTFDVVVQNEGGSVTDADADSNTDAQGEDGTTEPLSSSNFIAYNAGNDDRTHVHETANWAEINDSPLTGGENHIKLRWSPDGNYLALAAWSTNEVRIFETDTWTEVTNPLSKGSGVWALAWSPDGGTFAFGGNDANVYLYDTADWSELSVSPLQQETDIVRTVAWSPNGSWIAYGSGDTNAYVHDASSWNHIETLAPAANAIQSIVWSPDESNIAYVSTDTNVYIHNSSDWGQISASPLTQPNSINYRSDGLAWSADDTYFACGDSDGFVYVFDTSNWNTISVSPLTQEDNGVLAVDWSSDVSYLAYGGYDQNVYIHNTSDWGTIAESPLTQPSSKMRSIDWSP